MQNSDTRTNATSTRWHLLPLPSPKQRTPSFSSSSSSSSSSSLHNFIASSVPLQWRRLLLLLLRAVQESLSMAAESSRNGDYVGDVLLHGDLELKIVMARNLPNMDKFTECLRRLFGTCGVPISSDHPAHVSHEAREGRVRHHTHVPRVITSDSYVKVCVAGVTVARTRVIHNSQNPFWNESFKIPLAHRAAVLEFQVKDNDFIGAELMGTTALRASRVASGEPFEDWLRIIGTSRELKPDCELLVSLKFVPVEKNPLYEKGIARDPEQLGIRDTYFPVRKGGKITLYQDAHVREGELPNIELDGGNVFQQEKCWEDICHAILDAQRLIYITGWSIYHKVKLVREPTTTRQLPKEGNLTLGELLKKKSKEGVRVCLLVWDDKTSHDKFFLKTAGIMQTRDEETRKFFKNSSVFCVLSPRYASSKLSMIKQKVHGTIFSHHQKCVLVDTEASSSERKITAFIGGLDLCNGRYDTPTHRLYDDDDDSVFYDDFQNPSLKPQSKGPRQPWHDLHCKIEGPAAYDVLENFEQRWLKATRFHVFIRTTHWRDVGLIKIDHTSGILIPKIDNSSGDPTTWVSGEVDPETWHVQIFRSIDSGSVRDFPKHVPRAKFLNHVREKHLVIDKSIQTAYIEAIRSAQYFIYIESQYFLGSCHGWPSYKTSEASNLVPMELALKIASKIRDRKDFAVYIIIPMWPEGDPTNMFRQEILYWQSQTMMMMYDIIAKEIKSNNLQNVHPQHYLNFYCLGARENGPQSQNQLLGEMVSLSHEHRRFMIYVHSKGMIVDDEYVILGSANINQRSLDGSRDTEISMGAYQPHSSRAHRGQVYGYRMSLWAEHLGMVHELFQEPQSLECVKYVNELANENWKKFTDPDIKQLKGHLLPYPIRVDINGNLGTLDGYDTFPDVEIGGKVLGEPSKIAPDQCTM